MANDNGYVPISIPQMLMHVERAVREGTAPVSANHGYPKLSKMTEFRNAATGQTGLRGVRFCVTTNANYNGPSCPVCGAINDLKRCAGCERVFYCDKGCQKHHWKQHKPECGKDV